MPNWDFIGKIAEGIAQTAMNYSWGSAIEYRDIPFRNAYEIMLRPSLDESAAHSLVKLCVSLLDKTSNPNHSGPCSPATYMNSNWRK